MDFPFFWLFYFIKKKLLSSWCVVYCARHHVFLTPTISNPRVKCQWDTGRGHDYSLQPHTELTTLDLLVDHDWLLGGSTSEFDSL